MIELGCHNGLHVFEPINDWLQSSEDGLRFHRTMNPADVYEGPLDIAAFGKPVAGSLADDKNWLVNPVTYDPTRALRQSQVQKPLRGRP